MHGSGGANASAALPKASPPAARIPTFDMPDDDDLEDTTLPHGVAARRLVFKKMAAANPGVLTLRAVSDYEGCLIW